MYYNTSFSSILRCALRRARETEMVRAKLVAAEGGRFSDRSPEQIRADAKSKTAECRLGLNLSAAADRDLVANIGRQDFGGGRTRPVNGAAGEI